jgi:hypothetical protein
MKGTPPSPRPRPLPVARRAPAKPPSAFPALRVNRSGFASLAVLEPDHPSGERGPGQEAPLSPSTLSTTSTTHPLAAAALRDLERGHLTPTNSLSDIDSISPRRDPAPRLAPQFWLDPGAHPAELQETLSPPWDQGSATCSPPHVRRCAPSPRPFGVRPAFSRPHGAPSPQAPPADCIPTPPPSPPVDSEAPAEPLEPFAPSHPSVPQTPLPAPDRLIAPCDVSTQTGGFEDDERTEIALMVRIAPKSLRSVPARRTPALSPPTAGDREVSGSPRALQGHCDASLPMDSPSAFSRAPKPSPTTSTTDPFLPSSCDPSPIANASCSSSSSSTDASGPPPATIQAPLPGPSSHTGAQVQVANQARHIPRWPGVCPWLADVANDLFILHLTMECLLDVLETGAPEDWRRFRRIVQDAGLLDPLQISPPLTARPSSSRSACDDESRLVPRPPMPDSAIVLLAHSQAARTAIRAAFVALDSARPGAEARVAVHASELLSSVLTLGHALVRRDWDPGPS